MIDALATTRSETACRISDEVHGALSRKAPLRIQGAGRWLDAGAPVEAQDTISLERASGIAEYESGDLSMTALTGTPLADISAVAAEFRQWLPLDPFGGIFGTIGATVATGSYGPLAHMFGTPRDQLLGVEFVSGTGDIIRGGGRVTKNVAGFDLSRLVCGAWGTLGILTEITLRLRARPDRDVTLAVPLPAGGVTELAQMLERLRSANLTPAALELIDPALCAVLSIEQEADNRGALLVRFCSNGGGVEVQVNRMRSAFPVQQCADDFWYTFSQSGIDAGAVMVLRLSTRPSHLPQMWEFAMGLASRFTGSRVHASVGRGVVRCIIPTSWQAQLASALAVRPGADGGGAGGIIFEKLPPALWPVLAPASGMDDRLSTRVRDAFDPQRILNRGILGEALP